MRCEYICKSSNESFIKIILFDSFKDFQRVEEIEQTLQLSLLTLSE